MGKLGLAIGLIPFIDVIDALVSLCGRAVLNYYVLKQQSDLNVRRENLIELIKLYSPFQICNRQVAAFSVLGETLGFAIGDKVSLLIGAANQASSIKQLGKCMTYPAFRIFPLGLASTAVQVGTGVLPLS